MKADAKALKKGEKPQFGRQATLPTLFDAKEDKLPNMPMLNRNDTMATLPLYSSRPGTPSSNQPTVPAFELDQLDQNRPGPSRNMTGTSVMSNSSFASNAPLMGNASDMGYGRSGSPAPSIPTLDTSNFQRTGPSGGPPRMPSAMGDRGYTQSPVSYSENQRSPPVDSYGRPMPRAIGELGGRSNTPAGPAPSMGRRTPFDAGRSSPAPGPGSDYGRNSPAPGRGPSSPMAPPNGGYQSYNPNQRSASTAPYPNSGPPPQQRNMTDPGRAPPSGDYFGNGPPLPSPQRAATGLTGGFTPSSQRAGSGGSGYSGIQGPARLASPAPYVNNANGRGSPAFGPGFQQGGYRR
jgi:hypothetical protein